MLTEQVRTSGMLIRDDAFKPGIALRFLIPPDALADHMARIIFLPVTGTRGQTVRVTRKPVWLRHKSRAFDENVIAGRNPFRLEIDPWDLRRLIAEANRLGREGVEVAGYGYDDEAHAIVLGPKRADQSSPPPAMLVENS